MLIQELKNIKSGKKELRNFGIVMAVAFFLISALLWWKDNGAFTYTLIISGIFLVFGLLMPKLLMPVQKLWMGIAVIIGFFVSRVLLTVFFYLVITPIGLLLRLAGKDPLRLKFEPDSDSYWIPKQDTPGGKERFEKQY